MSDQTRPDQTRPEKYKSIKVDKIIIKSANMDKGGVDAYPPNTI